MPGWKPLATDAWRALWVRAAGAGAGATIAARTEFDRTPPPAGPGEDARAAPARVFVASVGRYRLYLNGRAAGEGPQRSAPPRLHYDGHDVDEFLAAGTNCLAVLVSAAPGGGPAAVIVKAEIPAAGFPLVVGTDSGWRACAAEWIAPSGEGGETHDPGAEPSGWAAPGFNDSAWPKAEVVDGGPPGAYSELEPRSVPPPAVEEVFPASCLRESANLGKVKGLKPFLRAQGAAKKGGRRRAPPALVLDASKPFSMPEVALDFGRLVRGRPVLDLEARAAGGEVLVAYGETPDLVRLDRVRLAGGRSRWSPMGERVFRYVGVALRGAPKPVSVRQASAEALTGAGGPPSAKFSSSDAALAAAFRIAGATLALSTADGIDERVGRSGATLTGTGLRATALATYYLGGDAGAVRGALLDLGARELAGVVPRAGPGNALTAAEVADTLFWAIALGEYVAHTGDADLAGGLLTRLDASFSMLGQYADRAGVFAGLRPAAASPPRPLAAEGAGLSFLACGARRAAAGVARALGRERDAARWTEAAGVLARHLRARFMRDNVGLFADAPTRLVPPRAATNAAALLWGGIGGAERLRVAEAVAEGQAALAPVPLEAALVAEALFEADLSAAAAGILVRFFGGMARRGATEFWEVFDPDSPPAAVPAREGRREGPSLACGPAAVAGALLLRYVAGIRTGGGPSELLLAPGRVGLERAGGEAALPGGKVRLEWKSARGRLDVRGRLPEGAAATLSIAVPRDGSGAAERFELAWRGKVFADASGRAVLPAEVERWERSETEVRLALAKGARFEVTRRPPR